MVVETLCGTKCNICISKLESERVLSMSKFVRLLMLLLNQNYNFPKKKYLSSLKVNSNDDHDRPLDLMVVESMLHEHLLSGKIPILWLNPVFSKNKNISIKNISMKEIREYLRVNFYDVIAIASNERQIPETLNEIISLMAKMNNHSNEYFLSECNMKQVIRKEQNEERAYLLHHGATSVPKLIHNDVLLSKYDFDKCLLSSLNKNIDDNLTILKKTCNTKSRCETRLETLSNMALLLIKLLGTSTAEPATTTWHTPTLLMNCLHEAIVTKQLSTESLVPMLILPKTFDVRAVRKEHVSNYLSKMMYENAGIFWREF